MKSYKSILKDGLILIVVSTVFVVAVNKLFSGLKKSAPTDPLVTAISQVNLDAAKDELKGADAKERSNRADVLGRTPLMWAAYANFSDTKQTEEADAKRIALVDVLLASGADTQAVDNDGWSALTWAAWSGLPQIAEKLVLQGAIVSIADRQGNTPLMIAAMRGHADVVRLLISKGADVRLLRKDGKSAKDLSEQARKGYPSRESRYLEVLQLLSAS